VSTFVLGPPPEHDGDRNRRIAELNTSFSDVAKRRGITYVDAFTPLLGHPVWQREVASSRDHLPAQEGYGLLAWLVLHRGWVHWLGVRDVLGDGSARRRLADRASRRPGRPLRRTLT